MSIKLITGATFDAVTRKVYDDIKENGQGRGRHIVIVPDQFALMSEKEVLERLNIKSSFNIEVFSFSRFAVKVLKNNINKTLNQYTSVMLLKKLAIENSGKLKCFGAVAKKNGYVNELYAAITNIRNSDIKPDAIKRSLPKLEGMLRAKAEDIAMLYEEYDKQLRSNYSDIGSCLEQLADVIPTLDWISGARFYITDFHEMSGIKLNIVTALCKYALSTTIGVAYDENAQNLSIQPKKLVDYVYVTAAKYGLTVERVWVQHNLPIEKKLVADRLFGYSLQTNFTAGGIYELYSAECAEHEIKGVARMIRRNIVGGYKYKDIAVICSDTRAVKDIIAREFRNFELPYYMDMKADFFTNAVCRIFAKAVGVIDKNFAAGAVLSFVKEGLFNASFEEKNTFAQYAAKYNVNYGRFTERFTIGEEDALYATAEKVRSQAVEYVKFLQTDSCDVAEIIGRVKDFYLSVFKKNNLSNYVDSLRKSGDDLNAEITELCVKKVAVLLDNSREIFDGDNLKSAEVYNILLSAFESVKVGMIPQFVDNIFIGTANKSKLSDIKILYVIGANDGAYPSVHAENGVLSQKDLDKLAALNVNVEPNGKGKYCSEKFFIMQTMLKGGDKVIVTYSAGEEKSLLAEQLIKILNLTPKKMLSNSSELGLNENDYALKIGTYENAKTELMRYYGERYNGAHLADENVYDYVYTKLCERGEDYNYSREKACYRAQNYNLQWSQKDGRTYASMSVVENFLNCPFKFFAQNVLKLKQQYGGEITAMDLGSFIHKVLELFFKRERNYAMSEDEIRVIVTALTREIFGSGKFTVMQYLLDDLAVKKQIVDRCVYAIVKLCANQRRSKFDIAECECSFGMDNSVLPAFELDSGGKKYLLRGKIDRIDKYGDYAVVIDYKTSSKIDGGVDNVYNGTRAQLLLYMNAYLQHSDCKPFGAVYMPLPYKYSDAASDDGYKYCGFLRNTEQIIAALDKDYLSKDTFLPIKATSGKDTHIKESSVYSKGEFELLLDYSKAVVALAIEDIESGYIAPSPLKCENCLYGNICKEYGNVSLKRNVRKVELKREKTDEVTPNCEGVE